MQMWRGKESKPKGQPLQTVSWDGSWEQVNGFGAFERPRLSSRGSSGLLEQRGLPVALCTGEGTGQRPADAWELKTLQEPTWKWHELPRSLLQGWHWNWGDGTVPCGLPLWPLDSWQAPIRLYCSRGGLSGDGIWDLSSREPGQPQQLRCSLLYHLANLEKWDIVGKLYHWIVEELGMMCWINSQ